LRLITCNMGWCRGSLRRRRLVPRIGQGAHHSDRGTPHGQHPLRLGCSELLRFSDARPTTLICPGDQWTDAALEVALELGIDLVTSYYLEALPRLPRAVCPQNDAEPQIRVAPRLPRADGQHRQPPDALHAFRGDPRRARRRKSAPRPHPRHPPRQLGASSSRIY